MNVNIPTKLIKSGIKTYVHAVILILDHKFTHFNLLGLQLILIGSNKIKLVLLGVHNC